MRTVLVSKDGFGFKRGADVVLIIPWDDERVGTIMSIIHTWVVHGILPE